MYIVVPPAAFARQRTQTRLTPCSKAPYSELRGVVGATRARFGAYTSAVRREPGGARGPLM